MNPTLLLVDDEPNVLASFARHLRARPYRVLTALDAQEAVDLMSRARVDVIVSDERMPGMSGSDLVAWVASRFPHIVRIMLSGQASVSAALRAINLGRVYRFLSKPIEAQELADTIAAALEERDRRDAEAEAFHAVESLRAIAADERAQMRRKASALRRQAARRLEFFASTTHELRSPLTALLGSTEMLSETSSNEDRAQLIDVIQRSGTHLLHLVNQTLDHAKIASGKIEIVSAPCAPRELIRESAEMFAEPSRLKGIELDCRVDESVPETVATDALRLRQILVNLLSNAVKFTDHGRVRVDARWKAIPSPTLEIDVADTGAGIAAEELTHLFRSFSQGAAARSRGGTGLGLSLSKRLARLLGGGLEVESEPGVGSVFSLAISAPLTRPATADEIATAAHGEDGGRVLLADDSPDIRRIMALFLRQGGYDATIVPDGDQAVDAAREAQRSSRPFDLVLLDLQMPGLDGATAARHIRDAGHTGPIVALTGATSDESAPLRATFDAWVAKPIGKSQLLAELKRLRN